MYSLATEPLIKVSCISKGEKLKMLRTGQKLSQRKLANDSALRSPLFHIMNQETDTHLMMF